MRIRTAWVAASLALCAGGSARAQEMYRWLDADGRVHYGSEPPADARSVAPWSPDSGRLRIESQPGQESEPAPPAAATHPPAPLRPPPARATPESIGGRTELEWRREARRLEDSVRDLEQKLEEFDDSTHAYGGFGTHRDRDTGLSGRVAVPDERKRLEAELHRSEKELEKLEEDARRAGVPPGWLR
jgi:hypothetical protein